MTRIYLAGPDVFARDALDLGRRHKGIVAAHGYTPLYPLDQDIDLSDPLASQKIFDGNAAMIRAADLVLANLNPFRGHEPDSGTVWEVGYAIGLGKPVIGYVSDPRTLLERVPGTNDNGVHYDGDGWAIEDFGHPLNLMLIHSMAELVIGTLEDAVKAVAKLKEIKAQQN